MTSLGGHRDVYEAHLKTPQGPTPGTPRHHSKATRRHVSVGRWLAAALEVPSARPWETAVHTLTGVMAGLEADRSQLSHRALKARQDSCDPIAWAMEHLASDWLHGEPTCLNREVETGRWPQEGATAR